MQIFAKTYLIKWEGSFQESKDVLKEMAFSAIRDFEEGKTEDDGFGDD
jgi:hypothetical protein